MYFAVPAPCDEDYFIQIDIKVCLKSELFEWYTFELNYASNSKIIGSIIKPLGLTIDPEGIHIRVEDIEETDHHGSMVCVSRDPKDVLRIAGLDDRIIHASFSTKEEIYQYFTSSWLFHPAHFAASLAEKGYNDRLEDRSPHWVHFIKAWVPEHYPGSHPPTDSSVRPAPKDHDSERTFQDLQVWYKHTRAAVCDKVFATFPNVAKGYSTKRAAHLEKQQEQRLKELLMEAIPTGAEGWKRDIAQPTVILTAADPEFTASHESTLSSISTASTHTTNIHNSSTPIYLLPLSRKPPVPCNQRLPPSAMSIPAKLVCLGRWTEFDSQTGILYVRCSPRSKDEDIHWTDALDVGATEEVLVRWAREAWWSVWARQVVVNYVGMWRRRFEKEEQIGG